MKGVSHVDRAFSARLDQHFLGMQGISRHRCMALAPVVHRDHAVAAPFFCRTEDGFKDVDAKLYLHPEFLAAPVALLILAWFHAHVCRERNLGVLAGALLLDVLTEVGERYRVSRLLLRMHRKRAVPILTPVARKVKRGPLRFLDTALLALLDPPASLLIAGLETGFIMCEEDVHQASFLDTMEAPHVDGALGQPCFLTNPSRQSLPCSPVI